MGNTKKDIIDYALNYIFKYQKTEKELIIQLRKRSYSEREIEKAISYLKEKKYVDDIGYIRDYIDYHLIKRGKSIMYAKTHLLQKGLNMKDIKQVISENIDEINEGIAKQILKEIENYKNKEVNQLDIIHKLNRKGYTLTQIRKVLDN